MKTGRPSLRWAQSNRRELKADDPSGPQGAPLPGTEPARWAAALANPRTRALEKPREPEARMWRHPRSSPAQGQATRSRLPWGPRQPSHSLGTAPSLAGQRGPRGAHPSSDHRIARTGNWHGPRHCSGWPVTRVSD